MVAIIKDECPLIQLAMIKKLGRGKTRKLTELEMLLKICSEETTNRRAILLGLVLKKIRGIMIDWSSRKTLGI
jgi:hypothetical protein